MNLIVDSAFRQGPAELFHACGRDLRAGQVDFLEVVQFIEIAQIGVGHTRRWVQSF